MSSTSPNPPIDDPTALSKFAKLEVIAKLIVEGFMMGLHKSPFKGNSVEFVEHRQYNPGDEVRHIDWRAFGKTGEYYIKEYEEETNLRAYLLVDASGSMSYGESTLTKYEYGRLLAASLGYMLTKQRDAVGLRIFDTKVRTMLEPSASPRQFQKLVHELEQHSPGDETSLSNVFAQIIPRLKKRSLVIIVSDFFDRIEPLTEALKQFRNSRHEVVLFQTIAPEEETFPFSKPTQFRNLERADDRKLVDPHRLRTHYIEQFEKFRADLTQVCGNAGVDFFPVTTDQPIHIALGEYLSSRSRR